MKVAAANSALPSLTIGTNTTAASKSLAIAWNDEEKTTKKADFSFGKNAPSFSIGSSDKKKKNAATKFSLNASNLFESAEKEACNLRPTSTVELTQTTAFTFTFGSTGAKCSSSSFSVGTTPAQQPFLYFLLGRVKRKKWMKNQEQSRKLHRRFLLFQTTSSPGPTLSATFLSAGKTQDANAVIKPIIRSR